MIIKDFRLIPTKTSLIVCGVYNGILKCNFATKSSSNKFKLPNVAKLARELSENELNNMKYDLNSGTWYIYENNIWKRINSNEALQNVWNILEHKEETKDNFTPEYNKRVFASLEMCSGMNFYSRQQ
jgi:hypothetical protein